MKSKTRRLALTLIITLSAGNILACELNGIDLAGTDNQHKYSVLATAPTHLSIKQYKKDIGLVNANDCKDMVEYRFLQVKNSGNLYYAIITNNDDCDGGNSVGALYRDGKKIGTISDSQISCK